MVTSTPGDSIYRLLVNGIRDFAIYMLTPEGLVSNWNAGAELAKGYRSEEIVGRHFSCFYTDEDRKAGLPQKALANALSKGSFEGEGWRLRRDGSRFWAHVVINTIRDDAGATIGFAKITRDMTEQRENQKRFKDQENSFRLLVQGVTDYAIYMLTPEGTVSNWNAGAERAKGYRAEEIVGRHFSAFYLPEDRKKGLPQRALATALAKGKFEGEGWRLRKDGSRFWAHVVIDPIRDENNQLRGFAKITRDLTKVKQQMDQVRLMKDNLDLALTNMSQGLCLFDECERLVLCNSRFQEILGFQEGAIGVGATFEDMLWALHADETVEYTMTAEKVRQERANHIARMATSREVTSLEQHLRGRFVAVNHRRLPTGGWVSTMEDITERKRIESRIVHMAHHDSLTQMPNRAAFRSQVEAALRAGARSALLYLDLDRFKPINDTLGHLVGDRVLQVVAERIGSQLRKTDVGGRLGGDEFAVLLADCMSAEDAVAMADRLIDAIERPIRVGSLDVAVGVSVGIAFANVDDIEAEMLLRNADLALYAAKNEGRGRHRCFETGMESALVQRQDLELDIRNALLNGEFSLHYQPIVDVELHRVTGFEALLRWESPTRGKVSPAEFIPFAEEQGLMAEIGDWVLKTACEEAASWQNELCISINLSPTQFLWPKLMERIAAVLAETGLPARRLELEITETAMMGDVGQAKAILNQLRSFGILIALDDFGTGYSSLSFLHSLPFTRVKIDKSFVQDLGRTHEALAIVRAITGLCSSLGVCATAEGVETEEQLHILQAEGCHEIQGYLFGRPTASPEMNLLTNNRSESQCKPELLVKPAGLHTLRLCGRSSPNMAASK